MKKKYFIYASLPIMAFAILGAVWASADTSESGSNNPMSGLVSAIAQKFNLNVGDVQAVFDEQRTQMQSQQKEEQQQNFADRLSKAVEDGKLTQAQADLITAKKAELDAQKESQKINIKDMTEEQRQATAETMKTQMTSLKQWATDNNIPEEYLMLLGFGGRGHGGGSGGPGFGGPENKVPASQNSSDSAN